MSETCTSREIWLVSLAETATPGRALVPSRETKPLKRPPCESAKFTPLVIWPSTAVTPVEERET